MKNKPQKRALMLVAGILLFLIAYNFDASISLFFKNARIPFLDGILAIISNFGVMLAVMLLAPMIMLRKNKSLVRLLLLAFIASFAMAFVIKLVVMRQRPVDAFTFPSTNITDYSFPSMHAMVAFALLPIVIKHLKKQKWVFISISFLVGFSRVYLGLHFLSDVVFGAFAGYFIGDSLLGLHEEGKL